MNKQKKEEWKIKFRLLMCKVVGWRNKEVDDELEAFISSLLDKTEKEAYEKGFDDGMKTQIISIGANVPANTWKMEVEKIKKQAQSEIIQIIKKMPTEFPERESDEYDRAYSDAKKYLLDKIKI